MLEKKLQKFNALSYQDKYNIAINIITNLKDRGNKQAQEIFDFIEKQNKVSETFLENIYKDFEVSIEKIKEKNVKDDLHKFDNATKYLDMLREEEAKEREIENPEDILKKI